MLKLFGFELIINLVSGNLLILVSGYRNSTYFPEKNDVCVIRTIRERTKVSFPFFHHQTNLACNHTDFFYVSGH